MLLTTIFATKDEGDARNRERFPTIRQRFLKICKNCGEVSCAPLSLSDVDHD